MRIALLQHAFGDPSRTELDGHVRTLAQALREAGHDPSVLGSRPGRTRHAEEGEIAVKHLARLPDERLRSRGFDAPLTHLPALLRELRRGGYDAVHAFTPLDAWAGARAGGPIVFTPPERPSREALAERRLRLALWDASVRSPNHVVVPDESTREAVWRWLAADATVAAPGDAPAHVRIYRSFA